MSDNEKDFVQLSREEYESLQRMGVVGGHSNGHPTSRLSLADKRFIVGALLALFVVIGAFALVVSMATKDSAARSAVAVTPPKALSTMPFKSEAGKSFTSKIEGLVGWAVLSEEVGDNVIYATPDGEYMVVGVVIDKNGENITKQEMVEHLDLELGDDIEVRSGSKTSTADASEQLSALKGVQMEGLSVEAKGGSDKEVWVAIDMNCPFCHQLIQKLDQMLEGLDRHAAIELVPVCVLGIESCAVESMLSEMPVSERLVSLLTYVNSGGSPFSFVEEEKLGVLTQAAFLKAQKMMQSGISAVPSIYWADEEGEVNSYVGLPSDEVILDIFGG